MSIQEQIKELYAQLSTKEMDVLDDELIEVWSAQKIKEREKQPSQAFDIFTSIFSPYLK